MTTATIDTWTPSYSSWRHGGWYVNNVYYPQGAVGCVSRNFEDKKWRVVCAEYLGTFPNRDAAARAEYALANALDAAICPETQDEPCHGASLGWRCQLPVGHDGSHKDVPYQASQFIARFVASVEGLS